MLVPKIQVCARTCAYFLTFKVSCLYDLDRLYYKSIYKSVGKLILKVPTINVQMASSLAIKYDGKCFHYSNLFCLVLSEDSRVYRD